MQIDDHPCTHMLIPATVIVREKELTASAYAERASKQQKISIVIRCKYIEAIILCYSCPMET